MPFCMPRNTSKFSSKKMSKGRESEASHNQHSEASHPMGSRMHGRHANQKKERKNIRNKKGYNIDCR